MKKKSAKRSGWTKPEIKRLGRIADVAGAQTPHAQAAGNVKS